MTLMSLVSFGMLIKIPPRSSCNPSSSSFLHGPFLLLLQPITSDLQDNKLEGTIPQSLYELRSLRSLRLEGNAFTQTSTLTIEETDEWKACMRYPRGCRALDLRKRGLTGSIPASIGTFVNLIYL